MLTKESVFPPEIKDAKELMNIWTEYRKEVFQILQNIPSENFATTPPEGGWSASEIAEHLYLVELSLARSIPIVLAKKFGVDSSECPPPDYRKILLLMAKPRKAKNPENTTPLSKYDLETAITNLSKSHEKLIKNSVIHAKSDLSSRGMEHPFWGNITLFDWLWVMGMHENSHLYALRKKYPII